MAETGYPAIAFEARIKALEDLAEERSARITELEKAVISMDGLLTKKDAEIAALKGASGVKPPPAPGGVGDCSFWTADKVRSSFIEFFEKENKHTFWPSSPCVPHDDPTLLFANAGMNQYKPLFLGQCDPALAMAKLKRATNSQKCIRAGGKKCDLDDVGKDVYHHTYFEMLGNWSFGDYFKEEAIRMTWECLTVKFGLEPSRIYVTYFGGDEKKAPGVPSDEETRQIWLKYVSPERLLPFDAEDNFWEMGDVGPCGPCTEIHYDRIGGRDAAYLVNMDDPDVLEIWNNVFIQYNREPGGLKELPAQHVDTGMGFERLTSVMQDKPSNYDTDVFAPLFAAIQKQTGAPPYTGKVGKEDVDQKDMAYRVLSDHIRALSFAITDGARPDSNERGYVLRRILRRAVYYGRFLGVKEGESFFYHLVDSVVDAYGHFFAELKPCRDKIVRVIKEEEELFNRTITAGMRLFNRKTDALLKEGKTELPGEDCFLLSGSMGFPLDLTEIMAEQKGMTVNKAEYEACVEKDREESRKRAKGGGEAKDMIMMAKETSYLTGKSLPTTDATAKYLLNVDSSASVLAIYTGRGGLPSEKGFVESADASDGTIGVVLDKTPFYAQQGGQTFDTGLLTSADGSQKFKVTGVQVYAGFVVHLGVMVEGTLTPTAGAAAAGGPEMLTCLVDYERRYLVQPNHSMTHVLNWALRSVLMGGPNEEAEREGKLNQKGSDCNDERLRFDFAWDEALTAAQLEKVEAMCVGAIGQNLVISTQEAPLEQAKEIHGVRKVFGERYPDPVRVVSVGQPVSALLATPGDASWGNYSVEFCGGTHVHSLGESESFCIVEETGSSAGVRRISALTKGRAEEAKKRGAAFLARVAGLEVLEVGKPLVTALKGVKKAFTEIGEVGQTQKYEAAARLADMDKKAAAFVTTMLKERDAACTAAAKELAEGSKDKKCLVARLDFGANGKTNSKIMKTLSKPNKDGSFMVVSADEDNDAVCVFAQVAKSNAGLDAVKWCEAAIAPLAGPKANGRANNASGSGKGLASIDAVVAAANKFIEE